MSVIQTLTGVVAVSAAAVGFLGVVLPAQSNFMVVHDISYDDGVITAERTIFGPKTPADWRVTVASHDINAPVCFTEPSDILDDGWSIYRPSARKAVSMPLDVWVGQDGCLERLQSKPGEYAMYITWTPRDGRDPVTYIGGIHIP